MRERVRHAGVWAFPYLPVAICVGSSHSLSLFFVQRGDGELYHHGIPGQKWGKRNGPPYPLSKHSAAERRVSLDKSNRKRYNKSKTIERGKYLVGSILGKIGGKPITELNGNSNGKIKMLLKPESVEQVIKAVNPSHSTTNCSGCIVASPLRLCGYDVTAASDIPRPGRQIHEVAKAFNIDPDNQHEIFDVGKPTIDRISRNIEKQYKNGDIGASHLCGIKSTPPL